MADWTPVDHYFFFDLDKTLYAYDFRKRLPALARLTGASQYHLARTWWADGYEARAEVGEWATADDYLDAFAEVTGTRRLSLTEWGDARASAMTRIEASVDALRRAAELGIPCLLTNNPPATLAALPRLVPDVVEIVGPRLLASCLLGARKPEAQVYARALERVGATPEQAFLADDSSENVAGARAAGWSTHRLTWSDGVPDTNSLAAAVEEFGRR